MHNEENSGTVCWGTAKCKAQTAEEDVITTKSDIRKLEGQFGEDAIKMKRILRRHKLENAKKDKQEKKNKSEAYS